MATDSSASGQLRALIVIPSARAMALVNKIPKKDAQMIEFLQEAASLGLVCTPLTELKGEVARQIASRMVKRDGDAFIWQTATPAIRLFPVLGTTIFPSSLLTKDSEDHKIWTASTTQEVLLLMEPLLAESSSCCGGLSKAFKTASERVIRVVASIMPPATIEWTRTPSNSTGSLSGMFWYAEPASNPKFCQLGDASWMAGEV